MKGSGATPERRTRYLLGLASEQEREALEAEFFADDESFERLEATEDKLFQDYAAGRMAPDDEAAFRQRHLSSPEGRWLLTFERALLQRSDEAALNEGGPRHGALRSVATWVALAACLAIGVTAIWLAVQNARLRSEVDRLRAERAADPPPVPSRPADPKVTPDAPESQRTAVQAVRLPAQSPPRAIDVTLVPGTRSIRLEVALSEDEDSATFDAVIRRPGGEELWRQEGLAPKRFGAPIVVMAPADALPDGEYVLSIEGEPSREGPQRSTREYTLRLYRKRL